MFKKMWWYNVSFIKTKKLLKYQIMHSNYKEIVQDSNGGVKTTHCPRILTQFPDGTIGVGIDWDPK